LIGLASRFSSRSLRDIGRDIQNLKQYELRFGAWMAEVASDIELIMV
jgi:hypothetical protein